MKLLVLGTCRGNRIFHKYLSGKLIDNTDTNITVIYPRIGFLHSSEEVLQLIKFMSNEEVIDFSSAVNKCIFRKENPQTTPHNEFDINLENAIQTGQSFKFTNYLANCDAIYIEISSIKYNLHKPSYTYLHTNPNFIKSVTYEKIYPKGYYNEFLPELDIKTLNGNIDTTKNNILKISQIANKPIYLTGHLVDPENKNPTRLFLNNCLSSACDGENVVWIDTERFVGEYGFLIQPTGNQDIHHLSHEGEMALGKHVIKTITENN